MKQPNPPQPPDPNEIARADATFNRIDQITPYGSLWYGGPNRNRATLTFSPEVQDLFDQQIQSDRNLLASALRRQGLLNDSPINLDNFDPLQSEINTSGINFNTPDFSGFNPLVAPQLGALQGQVQGADIQGQLAIPDLPALPTNLENYRGDVEQAIFDRSRRLMDPVFSDQQRALEQQLANQGLPSSTEAYGRDLDRFRRSRNEAYTNLADQAVIRGGQEASRALGDLLRTRGQGFNEALGAGNFANQAAGQLFGQNLAQGNFANQAALNQFNAGLMGLGAEQGIRNQLMSEAGFGNQVAGMRAALEQQQLENRNRARSQALAEAMGIRGNQFNELASLLGMQQVQAPGLSSFYAPGNVNVLGANQLAQQGAWNNYNAQMNNAGLFNNGLFGLGAAFLGGPAFGSLFGGGGGGGGAATWPGTGVGI